MGSTEMGEGSQKAQTSSYKINKSWGCNVQHGNYVNNDVYLKVFKRVDLKSAHLKKKILCIVMDVNQTYCGGPSTLYANIESL